MKTLTEVPRKPRKMPRQEPGPFATMEELGRFKTNLANQLLEKSNVGEVLKQRRNH